MSSSTYELLKRAEAKYNYASKYGLAREEAAALNAFKELHENNNSAYIEALNRLKYFPVSIDEFIESEDFLNSNGRDPVVTIWEPLRPALRAMNPDVLLGDKPVYETVMAGATGIGKSLRRGSN